MHTIVNSKERTFQASPVCETDRGQLATEILPLLKLYMEYGIVRMLTFPI
jgi:hypothetical protein